MESETTAPPAPTKADAVKAWNESTTDDARRAAVKQFPILAEIYSAAGNFKS